MREAFDVYDVDAAGRRGELRVPRGPTVETPALLPVVNPHIDTIAPSRMAEEFGVEALITNAYVIHGDEDLREAARQRGLHDLLDFDGVVMTDSGSFQLSEYGEIDVTTAEILEFQVAAESDIATPVDVPTSPAADRETTERDLRTTQERLATAESVEAGETLVTAPVQGGAFPGLREAAGRHAADTELDVFPIGGMVPLLNDYRYADVVEAVLAAKRGLDPDCPVHLFGAGHPVVFALAAAMGCDLFDSAAYALYARDDRYLTRRGTRHLADLETFPCECPVCTAHTPETVRDREGHARHDVLAEHNLHVSVGEMRRVRDAVRAGTLLELVETRARSHPAVLDGYRALLEHAGELADSDPARKDTFRYLSAESARRPEVHRHHERLDRVDVPDRLLLTEGRHVEGYDTRWDLLPPFGPVPEALTRTYPLTAETPDRTDRAAREAAARGVARLAAANPQVAITVAHHGWRAATLDRLPDRVTTVDLDARDGPDGNGGSRTRSATTDPWGDGA
jgi:7-cyano-7-deazaguanine tRNA-ribosyltransferase